MKLSFFPFSFKKYFYGSIFQSSQSRSYQKHYAENEQRGVRAVRTVHQETGSEATKWSETHNVCEFI